MKKINKDMYKTEVYACDECGKKFKEVVQFDEDYVCKDCLKKALEMLNG